MGHLNALLPLPCSAVQPCGARWRLRRCGKCRWTAQYTCHRCRWDSWSSFHMLIVICPSITKSIRQEDESHHQSAELRSGGLGQVKTSLMLLAPPPLRKLSSDWPPLVSTVTKGSVCICSIPHARLIVGLQRLVQGRSSDVCCVRGWWCKTASLVASGTGGFFGNQVDAVWPEAKQTHKRYSEASAAFKCWTLFSLPAADRPPPELVSSLVLPCVCLCAGTARALCPSAFTQGRLVSLLSC